MNKVILVQMLIPITILLGGFTLYLTLISSWLFSPLFMLSVLVFGFYCYMSEKLKEKKYGK